MASGQVTLKTESVDYGGGRGAVQLTNVIGWNVDSSNNITFTSISSSDNAGGTWGICTSQSGSGYGVIMEPQVSYDSGQTWQTLDTRFTTVATCPSLTNVIGISVGLVNSFGSYHLNGTCQLRFLYYANRNPAPSPGLPNAFPNSSYSEQTQVPASVVTQWTATIHYDANGGSGAPADDTATSTAQTQTLTISNTIPTKTGNQFSGWEYGGSVFSGGDTITLDPVTPSVTMVAQWVGVSSYRPGARKINGIWSSLNRSGGACERKDSGTWTTMDTYDGGVGTDNPPSRKHSDVWYNMIKEGAE